MNFQGLKILLIDDTLMVLQRLQFLLSELKQVKRTEAVMNAEAALVLMEQYEPDIIILDINMPGMNGIEMLKKLAFKQIKQPVVIMLTNNIFAGYRHECLKLGADYFLDKSRDFQSIPSIIEKIHQHKMVQC